MVFSLTKDLMTGNEQIDAEHAKLLEIINTFITTSSLGQEEQTLETLKFLVNYVKTHFAHEESLQKQSKYPQFQKHWEIHRALEGAVLDVQKEFEKDGFSYELSSKVIVRVGGCIMAHILSEDKAFAQFLEQKK